MNRLLLNVRNTGMYKRLSVVAVVLCFIVLPSQCGCQRGERQAAEVPQGSLGRVQPSEGMRVLPGARDGVEQAEKTMAQLRIRFANRSDEEIVQILRGYALAAPPDDGNSIVWLAKRLSRAKKQQEAVEAVEGLHGGIFYDYQKGSSICCPAGEPRAPTWLRRQLSDHFFVDVVGVSLSGDRITNEILSRLKAFPSLEFVVLRCPKVDNDGLAHLAGLTRLNYIELRETRVTRDAAEELARALPENCAIDWNAQWIRQPESRRDQD